MRVLLVTPPKKVYGLNYLSPPVYHLGFLYMASLLLEKEIDVTVFDALAEGLSEEQSLQRIENYRPDVVGLSATTPAADYVLSFAQNVKTRIETYIVLGGPHFSFFSEYVLKTFPAIDFVVRGEGEYTFRDLVLTLESTGDLKRIPGLTFRDTENRVIKNIDRQMITNLDDLPLPAYDLIDMKKYGWLVKEPMSVTISTSRGCLGGCGFCNSFTFWEKQWRSRSPESLMTEIELLVSRYHAKFISFSDECFTWDLDRVERFFDLVLASGLKLKFYLQSRVDHIVQMKHMLPKLREAGLLLVFMGIEAADEQILAYYGKKIALHEIEEAFGLLRKNDILSWASFIVGGPNDTVAVFKKDKELVERVQPDFVGFQTYCIFPGTDDDSLCDYQSTDWEKMDSVSNVSSSRSMTPLETKLFTDWLKRSFPDRVSERIPEVIREALRDDISLKIKN